MASMKSMINVVLDVGPTMGQHLPAQPGDISVVPRSKLDLAKGFIGHFFHQRMMASKTIELGVVTFGDDVTKNALNTSMRGGYEHVHEVVKIAKPTVDTLSIVHGIRQGSYPGDLIDGIVTGQDSLVRINAGKAFNRIMLLVTDGETRVEGIADLEQIVPQMQAMKNFALYIAMVGKVTDSSTIVKQENAKLLVSLAENTGGRFLDIEDLTESVHLLSAGLGLSTKPALSKTFLELSPEVRVPCTYFSPVSAATLPSLKKRPLRRGAVNVYTEVIGAAVKRDTSYRDPEDESMEISVDERVKGYKYGATYIPVTTADEDSFKIAGPAGVTVIGFINADRIPRHHFVDKAMLLMPTLDHAGSQRLFTTLILTLRREKKVGLVRFVKREHSDPFLAALMPLPESAQGNDLGAQTNGLLVHRLPCAEDVRDYNFPSLVTFVGANRDPLRRQQQSAMSSFIDAITLTSPSAAQLTPANATLHAVYGAVHARLLQEVSHGRISAESLFPVRDTFRCPNRPLAQLRAVEAAFPLEKTQKVSGKKRKIFWSEIDLSSSSKEAQQLDEESADNEKNIEEQEARRLRDEADARAVERALAGSHAQAETKETVVVVKEELPDLPDFTIGSSTPIEDFDTLIGLLYTHAFPAHVRLMKSREAISVMLKVADRQVTVGACKAAYDKAVACLQTLRRACLQVQDCAAFNAFLQMPCKAVHSKGRHALFWQLLKESQTRPISSAELPQSTMSEVAAATFFDGPGGGSAASSQVSFSQAPRAVPADEDDEAAFFSPWRK